MTGPDMLTRLLSPSVSTRISATYELDRDDFDDSRIVAAVRENLASNVPDLLDITIMRLMLRGRDVCSVERVLEHVGSTRDNLVLSSCVLSLSGLAHHFLEIGERVLRRLELLPQERLHPENKALVADTIAELRQMTA
jgi:hypothetical protein